MASLWISGLTKFSDHRWTTNMKLYLKLYTVRHLRMCLKAQCEGRSSTKEQPHGRAASKVGFRS